MPPSTYVHRAIGSFEDPGFDGPVLEAGVEPQPEVDLVGTPAHRRSGRGRRGSRRREMRSPSISTQPVHLPGSFMWYMSASSLPSLPCTFMRQQFPHRRGGFVVELPGDSRLLGSTSSFPLLQRLNARPAHRAGAQRRRGRRPSPAGPPTGRSADRRRESPSRSPSPAPGVGVVAVPAGQQQRCRRETRRRSSSGPTTSCRGGALRRTVGGNWWVNDSSAAEYPIV